MKETFSCADGRSMLDGTRATVFSGMGGDSGRRRYLCPRWHVTATLNALGALVVGMVGGVDILKHDLERDVCLIFPSFVGVAAHCCHLVLALLLVRRILVGGLGHGQRRRISCMRANKRSFIWLFSCRGHRVVTRMNLFYILPVLCCCCAVTSLSRQQITFRQTLHVMAAWSYLVLILS